MIILNERFSLHSDGYNWVLTEQYDGKDKDGNPKKHTRLTYHPWPDRALRHMCEIQGKDAGSITELVRLYTDAVEHLRAEGELVRQLSSENASLRAEIRSLRKSGYKSE